MYEIVDEERHNKIDKFIGNILDVVSDVIKQEKMVNIKKNESKLEGVRYLPLVNMFMNELNLNDEFSLNIYSNIAILNNFFFDGFNGIDPFNGVGALINIGDNLLGKNESVDKFIIDTVKFIAKQAPMYMSNINKHPNLEDCSLLDGLSGIGAVLLPYCNVEEIRNAIDEVLTYIVKFINGTRLNEGHVAEYLQEDNQNSNFRIIDNTIGKGISGPLAFLSISLKNGIEVEGQKESIEIILNELDKYYDKELRFIPKLILSDEGGIKSVENDYSYINGVTGMARAIYLAGDSINNEYYKEKALLQLIDIANISSDNLNMDSPNVGEGLAGVLYILVITYKQTKNDLFIPAINKLVDNILGYYENYSDFIESICRYNGDKINHLDNILTVALALRECIIDKNLKWDKVLLLNY